MNISLLISLIGFAGIFIVLYLFSLAIEEDRKEIQADIRANRRMLDEIDAKIELIEAQKYPGIK